MEVPRPVDLTELTRRVGEHGEMALHFLEYCDGGGGGSGACRVADQSGHVFIMSSIVADEWHRAQHLRSMVVLERLWSIGHPVPRYEQVIDLGDVLVILQRRVAGVSPVRVSRALIDRLLELHGERAGIMTEHPEAGPLCPYLREDFPGAGGHDSLRAHDDRTRRLLD